MVGSANFAVASANFAVCYVNFAVWYANFAAASANLADASAKVSGCAHKECYLLQLVGHVSVSGHVRRQNRSSAPQAN